MSALSPPFRIIFFGTPEFAVPSLSALLQSRHHVAALVTQPDRPKGRGHHIAAPPAKLAAIDHGIPVLQPQTLKDDTLVSELTLLAADLGIVVAYGKILPDRILTSTRSGFLNVHASLLPRHRGAAPVNRAVMAGDATAGVTIMRVVRELDAGPTFAAAARPIGPDETSEQIEHDLARMGAALLIEVIEELAQGTAVPSEQDHRLATYAPRLTKAEGLIDWNSTAVEIHNKVRGLHPWPHAYTHVRGYAVPFSVRRSQPEPSPLSIFLVR